MKMAFYHIQTNKKCKVSYILEFDTNQNYQVKLEEDDAVRFVKSLGPF